jgi:hypothetical protein
VTASDRTLTITAGGDLDAVVKAAARFRVHALRSAEVDLDDVFHDYYRAESADAASGGAETVDAGGVGAKSDAAEPNDAL